MLSVWTLLAAAWLGGRGRAAHALAPLAAGAARQLVERGSGRVRLLHGVNAVFKRAPFVPRTDRFDARRSLAARDARDLREWGVTVVRLGVMWQGWEPVAGQVNRTFVAEVEKIVELLAREGIFTIVDQHQDLLYRETCGEGFPSHVLAPRAPNLKPFPFPIGLEPYKRDAHGNPSLKDCLSKLFALYYFSEEVADNFQRLYDNFDGIQDKFAAFWGDVARTFAGNPAVAAYELINEPFNGNFFAHPTNLKPGVTDQKYLAPLYDKLASAIRAHDPDTILMFEKSLGDEVAPSGFKSVPGGDAFRNRSLYSYHDYCAPMNRRGVPLNLPSCEVENSFFQQLAVIDQERLSVPGIMSEFGAGLNKSTLVEDITAQLQQADMWLQSWAYWQFKYFDDLTTQGGSSESFYGSNGGLQTNKVKALARTYAYAIAGRPTRMLFLPSDSSFILEYDFVPGVTGTTDIYLHEAWYYPRGFKVTLSPPNVATWRKTERNRLSITHTATFTTLTVQIEAE